MRSDCRGTPNCPYEGCPQSWRLNLLADGAQDSIIGTGSAVHTTLTVAPCTMDLNSATSQTVNGIGLRVTNQNEQQFSTSTNIIGPTNIPLSSIVSFTSNLLGTDYAQTVVSSPSGPGTGVLLLAQEFHNSGPPTPLSASAAINARAEGQRADQDQIALPTALVPAPGAAVFVPSGTPQALTSGPDGNLWFTEIAFDPQTQQETDKIGRIPPSGSPIDEFPLPTANAGPGAITTGPDGNLWFTENNASNIGRISTDGSIIREFPISAPASSISQGPDGRVFFIEPVPNRIGYMRPDGTGFGEISFQDYAPTSIALGPDGNLWFTEQSTTLSTSKIGWLNLMSSIVEFDLPPSGTPGSITLGPDGNLWLVQDNFNTASQIGRITPAGIVSEFAVPGPLFPTSIAPVGDGNLWFTGSSFRCGLGRVTPSGVVTTFLNLCADAVTGGPDGNVWLMRSNPPEIVRFAP
jgi:streptogramin lyase